MPKDPEAETESVIEFASSPEHYKAEACVAWCFDARFANLYDDFLAKRGIPKSKVDPVIRAGGAKALAMENDFRKEDVKDEIATSIRLHHTERVILMVHMDCGGYGTSQAFDNDHDKEWNHHVAELEKAASFVFGEFPDIKTIECHIGDFDGLHRVKTIVRPDGTTAHTRLS